MTDAARQGDKLNVFISYSRDDLAFADQLDAALGLAGFGTIIDRHGISAGEDWQTRLGALIRDSDTVVFVLSPSSARSKTCAWEVEEAVRLGKRILPVLCRSLEDAGPPPQLAKLNYIYFFAEPRFPGSGFGVGLVGLASALNTDLDWLREHTRTLQRATEWDVGGRPANRLLSGPDIATAKAWAARRPKNAPEPTALQLDFIKASETEAARQQSAEAQRLQQVAVALAEREKAQEQEAEARRREAQAQKREAEAQKREAEQAKRVAQRTRVAATVFFCLFAVAFLIALFAYQQRQTALAGQEQLVEAAATRARELIGYVWTDLSAKHQAQVRLAKVTEDLAQAQKRLGQRPANRTGDVSEIEQPDGFDCKTTLSEGFRYLYCLVRNVISVPKLEAIAGRSTFLPVGPHSKDLNLTDQMQFGHYDPFFLDWLEGYLIPTDAGDVRSNPVTKQVYDAYFGPTARALYRTHEVLFADPAKYQAFEGDYATLKKQFYRTNGGIGSFNGTPVPFATIKAEYLARLAQLPAQRAKDEWGGTSNGVFFESRFTWLSDYVLLKYNTMEQCCEPWYLASSSAGFWVRRSIDGTEPRIFGLVKKVLAAFEPAVLVGH
jgi:hypothetical protein